MRASNHATKVSASQPPPADNGQPALPLMGALLPATALYALMVVWFWLPALLPRGRVTVGTMTQREAGGAILLLLIGGALYALWLGGAWLLQQRPASQNTRTIVWGGAILVTLLLIGAYPVTSGDLFDYIFRARMALRYDANPYLVVPNRFKADPWFRYVGWPNAPSAYGPLWEQLSVALSTVAGDSLLRSVALFKTLAAATHLAVGVVIGRLVSDTRQRVVSQYLWLWCPLALWELPAIGHNDGLLILSLVLSLWAVRRKQHWLAILLLTAGALLKFLPAVLLPLVALDWMRRQATPAQRIRVGGVALVLALAPAVALYARYWDVPPTFTRLPLIEQARAIRAGSATTLHNLAVRADFLHATPMAVVSYTAQTQVVTSQVERLMQLRSLTAEDVRGAMSRATTVLLGLGVVWQGWHVWFRRRDLGEAFFGLCLWYIVTGLWFQPWYLLWLLALIVVQPHRRALVPLTVWMIAAQASYLLQFIVLPRLGISGQSLTAQVIYLLLIYPWPALTWLALRRREARAANVSDSPPHAPARKSSTT